MHADSQRPREGGSDVFELPLPNYDAMMDREQGKRPPGVREEALDALFVTFGISLAQRVATLARVIGVY